MSKMSNEMGKDFLDMHYNSSLENLTFYKISYQQGKHIISVGSKQFNAWNIFVYTVCPGSFDTFYIVSYYIKWVTTSWTHGTRIQIKVL